MNESFPRALIMAHYDRDGLVDPHVLYSLAAYRHAFSHITFVSVSADRLPKEHEHLADTFIARENVGYDFSSWKIGFNALIDKERFFEVVFVNDSIYGPFFDIEHVLAAPKIKDADFWGLTSSFEHSWHVQSFFFSMRHGLLVSAIARQFWEKIEPLREKGDIIMRYEIPMADFFRRNGWSVDTIFTAPKPQPQWNVFRMRPVPRHPIRMALHFYRNWRPRATNSTLLQWRSAIEAGVPFLKVELLRSNPLNVPLEPVREFIARSTRYPISLIDAHIQRTGRPTS
jgi:lipopolysaccharide biosynthesis protein